MGYLLQMDGEDLKALYSVGEEVLQEMGDHLKSKGIVARHNIAMKAALSLKEVNFSIREVAYSTSEPFQYVFSAKLEIIRFCAMQVN